MAYGTLFADEPGVPAYSGPVARAWGDDARYLDRWRPTAQKYPVKSAARVLTWEELVDAVCNGYPVTTASGVGYEMKARADGFHHRGNAWDHQMCFVGVDETWQEPYALILNNWGDVHGTLSDFRDPGVQLPPGLLRVRRADAEAHLAARDSYAYSSFEGFPERDLDGALFDVLA